MRWFLKLATTSVLLGFILASASQAQLANTKIAFSSSRDGNSEIYVMNSDGTNQLNITNNPSTDLTPAWSPDGSKIAFASDRTGNFEIWVINSDGTGVPFNVTHNGGYNVSPSWSPDGLKLTYEGAPNISAQQDIWVINVNGTTAVNLTNTSSGDASPSWSPDGTKIAFQSIRSGNNEIWVMNADGTNPVNLTNNGAPGDGSPKWSPNGNKIVFSSAPPGGNYDIYVMNADGTNLIQLTNNPADDANPSWSPDGTKITFMSNRDGNWEIYVMNSDGTNQTRLTNNTAVDQQPYWSPFLPNAQVSPTTVNAGIVNKSSSGTATFTVTNSGGGTLSVSNITSSNSQFTVSPTNFNLTANVSQTVTVTFRPTVVGWEKSTLTITHNGANGPTTTVTANGIGRVNPPTGLLANTKIAFYSNRDANDEIYIMNADGTNQIRLTNNMAAIGPEDQQPSWSPDGTKIAFMSRRDGNEEIYVMNADGTNQTRLTNNPAHDRLPSWSPDGTKVTFTSFRDGSFEVYVMDPDGKNQTRLTDNTASDLWSSWSPDGTKIAFWSAREGNYKIYVMNADGSNQTRLTNNTSDTDYVTPSWSPDGTKIVFISRDLSRGSPSYDIYVMNADGTNQTRLTNTLSNDQNPSWSPDGTKIIFDLDGEIYIMNADGTNQTRLSNHPALDAEPSWSTFLPIPSASTSQITATSAVADGTSVSTITITVKAANGTPLIGRNVTIAATGTANTLTQPSILTNSSGQTTATIKSTKAETKTITATVDSVSFSGTVTFTPGPVSTSNSTISANPITLTADGTAESTVTIILKDANNNLINGKNVTISATGTGNTITQPTSATDANGQTTAKLKSTKAEAKTISATVTADNITLTNTVAITFTPGPVSASTSTVTVLPTSVLADNIAIATVTVTLFDANNNPVSGKNVTISATGTGNTITQPATPTDANGQTTAVIKSIKAEVKTISATDTTDNIILTTTATVTFTAGAVSASVSTIAASPTSAIADGTAVITVTITLKDTNGNTVSGKNVTISATGTGNTLTQPTSPTDSNGQATATIKSTKAESKTISASDTTDNIALTNTATATFTAGAVSASVSTISASPSSAVADNTATITVTVILKDANSNPVSGKNVTIAATGTGNTITQPASPTDANGQATATIKSTKAEAKTISATDATDNIALTNTAAVTFTFGAVSASKSTISVAPTSIPVDNASGATVTVTLLDANDNPVSGKNVTISATGTGNTITQPTTATGANGQTTAIIKSTKAEAKAISATDATDNIKLTNTATVTFTAGAVATSTSTVVASPTSALADGIAAITLTITLKDANGNFVSGKNVTIAATGTNNTLTQPTSATDANGQATATIKSTKAEAKTISATDTTDNITLTNTATATFTPGPVSASKSTIAVSPSSISVDNTTGAAVTVTLLDANDNPVSGKNVNISVTGTGNTIAQPAAMTNANGQTTATIKSTKAEVKTISATDTTDNLNLTNTATVTFVAGTVSASTSTVLVSPTSVSTDSTTGATVTITLLDANNNPVSGKNVTISATGTGNTITQPTTPTDANGRTTATIKSTKAETKTITATVDSVNLSTQVTFISGTVSPTNSVITPSASTSSVDNPNGITLTLTLKDQFSNLVTGQNVTFNAITVTPSTGVTSPTLPLTLTPSAEGKVSFVVKSTKAETKTVSIITVDNIALTSTTTLIFEAGAPSTSKSTVSATTPVSVDSTTGSTVTAVLKDQYENLIINKSQSVNATVTPTTGASTTPAVPFNITTNPNGQFTFTVKSTKAEEKTLTVTIGTVELTQKPVIKFDPGAVSTSKSTVSAVTPVSVDNASGSTVTVIFKDQYENLIANRNHNVNATVAPTTGVSITPAAPFNITTDANGQFTFAVKSTKAEEKILTLTIGIVELTQKPVIKFDPGAVSAVKSIITATSPMSVDNTIGSTATVILKDQYDNPISTKIFNVNVTIDPAVGAIVTPTSPFTINTDVNGQFIFTVKSTKAEAKTLSIAVNSIALTNTATVIFEAGAPASSKSTVSAISPVSVDNPIGSTVTVVLKDQYENLVSNKSFSINVAVEPTVGVAVNPISPFITPTNANGQFTFAVKSTKAGLKTVKVTVNTIALTQQPTIKFEPGVPSSVKSTIKTTSPVIVETITDSGSVVTTILKDQYENPIANKSFKIDVVTIPIEGVTTIPTTPFNITTDENGQFSFSVKSSKAESKNITVTVDNLQLSKIDITFLPGSVSAEKTKQSSEIPAIAETDISFPAKIVILLRDRYDNLISSKPVRLIVTGEIDDILNPPSGEKFTDVSGKAGFTLASEKAGKRVITVIGDGIALFDATIDFTSTGVPSSSLSTVSLDRTKQIVGDQDTNEVAIKIKVVDKNDNPLSGKQVQITTTPRDDKIMTIQPASATNAQGETSARIRSTKAMEVAVNVNVLPDNIIIDIKPTIKFSPLPPEIITISSDKTELFVGQITKIKAMVEDKYKNLIKDAILSVSATPESGISEAITPVINNNDGSYSAEYKAKTPGKVTVKAIASSKSGNVELNIPNRPPILSFEPVEPYLIDEGKSLSIIVKATDPDGDKVILTATALTNSTFDVNTGMFVFNPTHFQAGAQKVSFTADDGRVNYPAYKAGLLKN